MKRRHIPLKSKLAAALACLLPQMEREYYRQHNAPADDILKLFEFDHIALHCFGGADLWWNLDPKSKAEHRAKSRRDTSIAAKVKRLSAREKERILTLERAFQGGIFENKPAPSPKKGNRKWPSRKIKGRPFAKGKLRTSRVISR